MGAGLCALSLVLGACSASSSPDEVAGAAGNGGDGATAQSAAGAGGDSSTSSCNTDRFASKDGASASFDTQGPAGGNYDGAAVIEKSTPDFLVIAFGEDTASGDFAWRTTLRAMDPMPRLPVGSKVWLTKSPAGRSTGPVYVPPAPYELAVRDKEGGKLLFATSYQTPIAPLQLIEKIDLCNGPSKQCFGGTTTLQALKLKGDTTFELESGHSVEITLDGELYDLKASASRTVADADGCNVSDLFLDPNGQYSLDLQAKDLASLVADLAVGAAGAGGGP